jgi:lysophospholipase L1-like esterase
MHYVSFIIFFVSIIIIVSCAYFKSSKEGLTNNDNIILIGDSVLNNSNYVSADNSVYDNLKTKTSNVFNYSKDGATISDCYEQLDKIPLELDKPNAHVFISAGGNNILNARNKMTSENIIQLFNEYTEFIKSVKTRLTNAKIYICNLYVPTNPRFQIYKPSIEQWNKLISQNSSNYTVIDLNSLLNTPEDFVYDIEPSELGSKKIANIIYLSQ